MKYCIICGNGSIPFKIAEKISLTDEVFLILWDGIFTDQRLLKFEHKIIPLGKASAVVKEIKARKINKLIIVGGMKFPNFKAIKPDFLGHIIIWKILRLKNKGDDAVLRIIGDAFKKRGIEILSPNDFLDNPIISTVNVPNKQQLLDINLGIEVLNNIAKFDIGQAIVIANSRIIGIEASEGTDELIKRCGIYYKEGKCNEKPILIKLAKVNQDTRLDLPTIGEKTMKNLAENNFAGIAINSSKTIITDPELVRQFANDCGIFVYNIYQ